MFVLKIHAYRLSDRNVLTGVTTRADPDVDGLFGKRLGGPMTTLGVSRRRSGLRSHEAAQANRYEAREHREHYHLGAVGCVFHR